MGIGDKITPVLVVIAALFAGAHIVLGVFSAANINWVHFEVKGVGSLELRQWKTRTRGLTLECIDNVTDSCRELESYKSKSKLSPRVHSVLDLRTAAFALPLLSATLTGVVFLLGSIIYIVFRNKPRYRQVLLLIMGIANWIAALSIFIGLITFLESKNQECHKYDPNFETSRAAWEEKLQRGTTESFGYAFALAIISCVFSHVTSFLLFTASLWA